MNVSWLEEKNIRILGPLVHSRNNPKTDSYEPKNKCETQAPKIAQQPVRTFISLSANFHLNTQESPPILYSHPLQDTGGTEIRIDELMDQPCANPRYRGITVREAMLRLRKRPKTKPMNPDSKLQNSVQFPIISIQIGRMTLNIHDLYIRPICHEKTWLKIQGPYGQPAGYCNPCSLIA